VKAYLFDGYWEDIGTIKSFFEANLALTHDPPKFEFFDPQNGPILTSPRHLPPARVDNCVCEDTIISFGAHVKDATVVNSIIGLRSVVRFQKGI
jgi:glucose-1-phosphate adenylyltransferase